MCRWLKNNPSVIRFFLKLIFGIPRLAALFMAVLICYYFLKMYGISGIRSHTDSMEPVHIKLNGKIPLTIPKAYLDHVSSWSGGDQEIVSIVAMLPDLKPKQGHESIDNEKVVYITLNFGASRSRDFQDSRMTEMRALKDYLIPTTFNLEQLDPRYFKDRSSKNLPGFFYQDRAGTKEQQYYFGVVDGWRTVEYMCLVTCSTSTYFSPHIVGHYIMPADVMPDRWQEVDKKIVTLVNSFVDVDDTAPK